MNDGMFSLDHRTLSRPEIRSDTNQAEVDPGPSHKRRQEGPAIFCETERGHRKKDVSEYSIP